MRRLALLLAGVVLAAWSGAAAGAPLDGLVARGLARARGASAGYVLDTTTGRVLASVRADARLNPASVEKLYTTSTALLRFGPTGTLQTSVLGVGTLDAAGTWHGDLYLRGGGDPTFGSAAFDGRAYGVGTAVSALATAVRAAGIVSVAGHVYGDESWLDSLRGGPASGYGLDLDIGGPLSALLYDRGLAKEDGSALQRQPALFAAQQLTLALRAAHVSVPLGVTGVGTAPASATALVTLDSPPMATLVKLTLVPSDNLFAEELVKDIGARFGSAGSTAAGAWVVRRTLLRFRIHPQVADGSGLSRADRTSPHQVVVLLNALRANAALRDGLPVAGRTGTLAYRMRGTSAQDRCQAKTGTLSNVSALAGYCTAANGHLLAFAFIENGVSTPTAKAAEDKLAIALARSRPAGSAPPSTPAPAPPGGSAAPRS
ncbi:MAG TPA: D-alanyl-D-alanine carboxypeptidase/D-alanyl-D-alanine-endopeptidase [Conexibacter sp.]|nr:D-alanyl-D-alanine carboxypeptidase/D-alanyl-D-alanine-endopeptidase [Conexibacter sp.]